MLPELAGCSCEDGPIRLGELSDTTIFLPPAGRMEAFTIDAGGVESA